MAPRGDYLAATLENLPNCAGDELDKIESYPTFWTRRHRLLLGGEGKPAVEGAAFAQRTLDLNAATVGFDDFAGDGEP